jgi:hypothetical protein
VKPFLKEKAHRRFKNLTMPFSNKFLILVFVVGFFIGERSIVRNSIRSLPLVKKGNNFQKIIEFGFLVVLILVRSCIFCVWICVWICVWKSFQSMLKLGKTAKNLKPENAVNLVS